LQWGSRERKVRASFLIFLYTLLGSIFLFFNIFYLKSKTGSVDYIYLLSIFFSKRDQLFLWITFFFAFAIKIPMFPFHIWLPEAHVEAPTIGSVILAALVLKLGLYGILRFCLPLFPYATFYYRPFINMFALLGILYTCLIALRQIDIKKIIAYSSINHMNVVLLGLVALQVESIEGAIFQMLSHGIISGALFFSVGILYERYGVRSLKFFGGLVFLYPLFSLFFFIFIIANISFPLTSSFVGEFLIFSGLIYEDLSIVFISLLSIIFGLFYNMWMYNRIFFGNLKNSFINIYINLSRKEIYLFSLLIFYLFLLGIGSFIILDDLHNSVLILLKIIRLG